jgi:exopolyphosphatase/pppGpp-phosphohydrolase
MKALNVPAVDVCPWALREGIFLHYLQTRLNESLVLPLRPLDQVAGEGSRALPWKRNREHPHIVQA